MPDIIENMLQYVSINDGDVKDLYYHSCFGIRKEFLNGRNGIHCLQEEQSFFLFISFLLNSS